MAQQIQNAQQQPGIPGISHFWDQTTTSYTMISQLYHKGPAYQLEDAVWHAWEEICNLYFPKHAAANNGPRWAVVREAYRGVQPHTPPSNKPDVLAIKYTPAQVQQQAGPVRFDSRDFLWIECKAPNQDIPSGWRTALYEAAGRLHIAHPTRSVFVIIAVGMKFMYFLWDPVSPAGVWTQPRLWVRPDNPNAHQEWHIDGRIKALHAANWVNTTSGDINTANAMSLECWPPAPGQPIPNANTISMLEQFLIVIQNSAHMIGFNPASF